MERLRSKLVYRVLRFFNGAGRKMFETQAYAWSSKESTGSIFVIGAALNLNESVANLVDQI